jgi:hypothetical protein
MQQAGNHSDRLSFLRRIEARRVGRVMRLALRSGRHHVVRMRLAWFKGGGTCTRMSTDQGMNNIGNDRRLPTRQKSPEWATGLRRLYDSVVEEPLPDSFSQLLDKLDDGNG